MSGSKISPCAALGLGDTNVDPDILTREIDHNFFDDPPSPNSSINLKECQAVKESEMPNDKEGANGEGEGNGSEPLQAAPLPVAASSCSNDINRGKSFQSKNNYEELVNTSGRSSSNVTVDLDVDRDQFLKEGGGRLGNDFISPQQEAEFYNIHQSNATSPNYPRPKQCYQLQQRRRSFGSIKKPQNGNGVDGNTSTDSEQLFQPMNHSDCGLAKLTGNESMSSSSSEGSLTESDLSDSSESELESLESDDEEFVDMLEKYFDYIDPDSDCSDLTEVSPLSSLAASPLQLALSEVEDDGDGDLGLVMMAMADMSLMEDNQSGDEEEFQQMSGLSESAADVAYNRVDSDKILNLGGFEHAKPQLPRFISTTEDVIVDGDKKKANGEEGELGAKVLLKEEPGFEYCVGAEGHSKEYLTSKETVSSNTDSLEEVSKPQNSEPVADSPPSKEKYGSRSSSSSACWSGSSVDNQDKNRSRATSSSGSSSQGSSSQGSSNRKRAGKNYTFTSDQMRKIERENHILLRKILDTNGRSTHQQTQRQRSGHHNTHAKPASSSTSITRIRQQKRIERENNILMRKLQSMKPSKEIVDAFGKAAAKN